MSNIKSAALYELNELYTRGDISYLSYSMIFDGLDDNQNLLRLCTTETQKSKSYGKSLEMCR